jgi:hypothetical protein
MPAAPPARRRRPGRRLVPLLLLGTVACGGNNPSAPTAADGQPLLLRHNARLNGGRTVRWATLPIPVFLNGIAQPGEVLEWTRATGVVRFQFVDAAPRAGIRFLLSGASDLCAITTVEYADDGHIVRADVHVAPELYRGPRCTRTIVHEVGHAIGFLSHTADGGLMDPTRGNGRFTAEVVDTIRALYEVPPGTAVPTTERARPAESRTGGRRVVTFSDHAD